MVTRAFTREFWRDLFLPDVKPSPCGDKRTEEVDTKVRELAGHGRFREFEEGIRSRYGISYDEAKYPSYLQYVSSLFLVDMLERSFRAVDVVLPPRMEVLDVGAGPWDYVHSLYGFLRGYGGEREAHLVGVDALGKKCQKAVERLTQGLPADFLPVDVFDMNERGRYDMVFMAHMLSSPDHFRKFRLRYRPHPELFAKLFDLMKPGGLFVGTAYLHAGEAAIFNEFPADRKILDQDYMTCYLCDFGPLTSFLSSYHTFDNNAIVLGRK